MNLVMCCTDVGREDAYQDALRFPLIAALFFKRLYPEGKVFIGTTETAHVPDWYGQYFDVLRCDFKDKSLWMTRQLLYSAFCESDNFTDDTVFTGTDVLFTKRPDTDDPHKMLLSYRYHRTQPFCSDMVIARKEHQDYAAKFFFDCANLMGQMPKKMGDVWSDQLGLTIKLGQLEDDQFNGQTHRAPRDKDVLLVPGDTWLYTPNDSFPSEKHRFTGAPIQEISTVDSLLALMDKKIAIHFKGNRKPWFFMLANAAYRAGLIDPTGAQMSAKTLFKEAFEPERAAA